MSEVPAKYSGTEGGREPAGAGPGLAARETADAVLRLIENEWSFAFAMPAEQLVALKHKLARLLSDRGAASLTDLALEADEFLKDMDYFYQGVESGDREISRRIAGGTLKLYNNDRARRLRDLVKQVRP